VAFIQQASKATQCPWLVLTTLHAAHGVNHVATTAKWTATNFGFVAKAIAGNLGLFYFSAHAPILGDADGNSHISRFNNTGAECSP